MVQLTWITAEEFDRAHAGDGIDRDFGMNWRSAETGEDYLMLTLRAPGVLDNTQPGTLYLHDRAVNKYAVIRSGVDTELSVEEIVQTMYDSHSTSHDRRNSVEDLLDRAEVG